MQVAGRAAIAPKLDWLVSRTTDMSKRHSEIMARLAELAAAEVTLTAEKGALVAEMIRLSAMPVADPSEQSLLDSFVSEHCHHVPGAKVLYAEFCDKYEWWLAERGIGRFNRPQLWRSLPPQFAYGIMHSNRRWIGNIAWEPSEPIGARFERVDGRLKQL